MEAGTDWNAGAVLPADIDGDQRRDHSQIRIAMHARIRLSRLRDIGWRYWDPVGQCTSDDRESSEPGGEYDDYLLKVARMLRHRESEDVCAQYLVWAESEALRLGIRADARSRAEATIAAIRADDQLWMEG